MTAKRTLIEDRLGRDLAGYVADLREDGASWSFIAAHIARQTQVTVTDQTVRNWFGDWPRMHLTEKAAAIVVNDGAA